MIDGLGGENRTIGPCGDQVETYDLSARCVGAGATATVSTCPKYDKLKQLR